MPTGSLPKEGKALWENVYDKALKGSCKGDKSCAAQSAWKAVKNAGWEKGADDKWHKKAVYAEFSLAISRASYDKATNRMNWRAVASDTDEDVFKDKMTLSLFNDFIDRIQKAEQPPEKYRSEFWQGGMPYMSLSHYQDLNGKAVPGKVESVYVDGNRLKSTGYFEDTPLGRACFKSVCNDLYGEEPNPDGKVRISIAFLDYQHKHRSNGYLFTRGNPEEPICLECIREFLAEEGSQGKEFLKGILIHEALTRVPANTRTEIATEVDKSMAIKNRKDDALSIVGEDEEAKSVVDEIADASELVGKSELVIKSETDEDEPVVADVPEVVEEAKTSKKEDEPMPDEEPDDDSKKKSAVDLTPVLAELSVMKGMLEGLKIGPVEIEEHPLDSLFETLRTAYDEAVAVDGDANAKLAALNDPFQSFSQMVADQVRSTTAPQTDAVETKSSVSVDDVVGVVMQKIGPELAEIKALLTKSQVTPEGQPAQPQYPPTVRRSLLTTSNPAQQPLQNRKPGVKSGLSVDDIVKRTT